MSWGCMLRRIIKKKERYLILLGIFLILGFSTAYNPDGEGGVPSEFGHNIGEIEGVENLDLGSYYLANATFLDSPEIIVEINQQYPHNTTSYLHTIIAGTTPQIPLEAEEVLVSVVSKFNGYAGIMALRDLKVKIGNQHKDLINLNGEWDNLEGSFVAWMPLDSGGVLEFEYSGKYANSYFKLEVQGYRL